MPSAHRSVPDDLDPESLPASADPYPGYRTLAALGVHRRAGGWVVGRAGDVAEALGHPHLSVAVAAEPGAPPGGARWWQARMARFADGAAHARRRAAVAERLAGVERLAVVDRPTGVERPAVVDRPTGVERPAVVDRPTGVERPAGVERLAGVGLRALAAGAAARTRALLACDEHARADAMVAARSVPVAVLAEALGVRPADADRVAVLTASLTAALAPWRGPRPVVDGDAAARGLAALLGRAPGVDGRRSATATDAVAAAMGLLFQACDATAGLAGNALLAWSARAGALDPAASVDAALRHDPPVHLTRRTATAPLVLGGHRVAAGDTVVVLLAVPGEPASGPASSGSHLEGTWGAGHHRCPGAQVAVALAAGVVAGVEAAGRRLVPGGVRYEPRPNLRVPARIPLRRPGRGH